MRTTVTLDDDLLAKAVKLTGGLDRSTVLREGLKALIERESAARLAKLGGSHMILVDTSVWIDYFREGLPELAERLRRSTALRHLSFSNNYAR